MTDTAESSAVDWRDEFGKPCQRCHSRKCRCLRCEQCGAMTPAPNFMEAGEKIFCDECIYWATIPKKCPHGRPWHACEACDREGDFQFDAARERDMFR